MWVYTVLCNTTVLQGHRRKPGKPLRNQANNLLFIVGSPIVDGPEVAEVQRRGIALAIPSLA